ncbi:MAG: lipid-binding SYLF domain-containing protein [Steroidobacteraceae bacterium]
MNRARVILTGLLLVLAGSAALADVYDDTIQLFRNAGQSSAFFKKSYAYAVFPTIGKAGLVVGGAYGDGKVYVGNRYVGDTTLTKLSIGFQAGGQAYSQIIFFQNKKAFDTFANRDFEFSANASAVLITAGATAEAGSTGASATASATKRDARTVGEYENGMAVFAIIKGGAMYEASLAGQRYKFKRAK